MIEQNISIVEVYSILNYCTKIKNKFYYISRNITINKCQVNRLIERIERFMQTLDEILTKKQQLTIGTLNKIKQLKDLFMRIGGHLDSYLRYGYLRRLLHPLEQEREFIFYTDQLCSIAQFFGFYLIEGQQRLREDEEDQLIDFAEFTQMLESVQGNDAKLLSFLGLDVDPTALPEVLHALENAIQMNGVSSNKIVTIDLKNEHLLSNTRILTFISNQLTQINRHLISTGQSQALSQGLSQGHSLINQFEGMSQSYTKVSYDYLKSITPPSASVVNGSDILDSPDLSNRKSVNNKSKNLTDFLGLNDPDTIAFSKQKNRSRSRSRSRSRHKKSTQSNNSNRSQSRNRSRNRSNNHSELNDDSDFIYETDLQLQERQIRQAITDVYTNKVNSQVDNGKPPPSPIVRGRSRMIKDTIEAENQPLRINNNSKSNSSPFVKSSTSFHQDNEEEPVPPVNLNILEFVDSDDSDEFDLSQSFVNSSSNFYPSQSLNSKVGYPPFYAPQEINASKLENNCLIIDTQLQLKYVYYELLRISGTQVGNYIKQAWKIPYWDLEFWDMIESTLISKIYRGIWHFTEVAVKEIDIALDTPVLQQQFQNYVENWYSLRHPHIIPLLGASQTHNIPYVVMPYLSKGNLVQYLENDLDIPHLISIILDISSGMQYLHSRQLIHGELMASNILIDNYGEPSICDLGFSKYFYFTTPTTTTVNTTISTTSASSEISAGNPDSSMIRSSNSYINRKINRYIRWTANEIQDNYVCTFASDVYSFGMLCYEIFSGGDVPFSDIPEKIIPEAVKSGKRPNRPPYCPDEIWELMQECWHINPDRRPSFYEISQRLMQIKTHYKIVYSNADIILSKSALLSTSPVEGLYSQGFNNSKSTSVSWMNTPVPSPSLNNPHNSYSFGSTTIPPSPKSPLLINNNNNSEHSYPSPILKHASIDSGFSVNSRHSSSINVGSISLGSIKSSTIGNVGSISLGSIKSSTIGNVLDSDNTSSKIIGINMNLPGNNITNGNGHGMQTGINNMSVNEMNNNNNTGNGNLLRITHHEGTKPTLVGNVNTQKISPYMKAAIRNNSILPNGNNNSSNNNNNNPPIGSINFNKLGRTTHLNYLQQLLTDEENSNINKFNESRVTNIPLSPSTTTDSDEVYDSLNRNEANAIVIVDKNGVNGRVSRVSPSLKQPSPVMIPVSPKLKQISPKIKQQRSPNVVYHPSPKLSSSGNVNIIKVVPTSSSANPILSHRPPKVVYRQNSRESPQMVSENEPSNTSPLLYYGNSQSHSRKGSLASNRHLSQTHSPLVKPPEEEEDDDEQYIGKNLMLDRNGGNVDIDLNNEQLIQQIENMNKSDSFMPKRINDNQQSREYIEKVLKKVSTIRKEYEISSDVDGYDDSKERQVVSVIPTPGAKERQVVSVIPIPGAKERQVVSVIPSPGAKERQVVSVIPSPGVKERQVVHAMASSIGTSTSVISINGLPTVLPPPQPLPTVPPPPPPIQEDVPTYTMNNNQAQSHSKIKVVSPHLVHQRKQYADDSMDESDRASISSRNRESIKRVTVSTSSVSPAMKSPNVSYTSTPTSKLNNSNQLSNRKITSPTTNIPSSSAQIQALSQLSKQLKRASFQLLMESGSESNMAKIYKDKGKELENSDDSSSMENSVTNGNLNRSRSLGSNFKSKHKVSKSTSLKPVLRNNQGVEIKGILRNASKSNPDLASTSRSYRSKTESNKKVSEEVTPPESSSTSKKSGIVGILKTTNNTIRNDSENGREERYAGSNGNNGNAGNTKSDIDSSNKSKSMLVTVLEKQHNNNANTVRFAIDDDTSSRGSMDEFDLKGMTADSMDQIANMLVNEEGEMKFDTKQQIMFHKKRLEECVEELRYRIGENQVKECIREDTIEINTYSWSDLSFKRTSIRILIDIIKHTFAKNIIIKDCRFSDLAAKCIAMAVKKNPYIKRLDITFCSKWARTQTDPITNILNYDSARYDSAWVLSKLVGPKAASAFASMLQVNTTLKVLQLRNASFGDTGVALIAKALQTNYVLECLEIENCCTAEYGCHAIAESLKVNKSLQFLSLSQNPLSDRGGIAIVDALQENNTLKALVLHRCALSSSKFCDSFSKALSVNQSIVEIDLGSNSFSKEGIKFIAEGLSKNSTLSILKLEDCNLSKKCVNILSKALDSEQNKTELHLGSVLKFWDKKEVFNKRILFHREQFA